MHARAVAIVVSLVLPLALAACGSSGAEATQAGGSVTVTDAWARAKEAGGTSAAYLTVVNSGAVADSLTAVSAPDVTNDATLHETTADGSGMMGMQHVDAIEVPAGGTVTLEPGGYHIMLMDLTKELAVGDQVKLTLTFEQAGQVDVTAEVRAN